MGGGEQPPHIGLLCLMADASWISNLPEICYLLNYALLMNKLQRLLFD